MWIKIIFHRFEAVGRGSKTQLQIGEKMGKITHFYRGPNISIPNLDLKHFKTH